MIFRRYYLGCLSHASYLVADEGSRVAVVVDPQRDTNQYTDDARRLGLTIRHVVLTHLHADFVSGHLELQHREGASIHLGRRATAEYPFVPAAEGDRIVLGPRVRLEVLETPGHTPESICLLVIEEPQQPPYAVLTGDTLFVGDVGRPDLAVPAGLATDELAAMLYDSLWQKLLRLPDSTVVCPAHGAGSLCGGNLRDSDSSTIGAERRHNPALQPMRRTDFVRMLKSDLPPAPAYFSYDAAVNARRRPLLEQVLPRELRPLSLEETLAFQRTGAQVLDTREPVEVAAGHLRGSLAVGLEGRYASWCGQVLDPQRPVVLVAAPGRERESALRLGRIGFDIVIGYLAGAPSAMDSRPDLVAQVERLTPARLAALLTADTPPLVLDVRTEREHRSSRIDRSVNVPLQTLATAPSEPLSRELADRDVVVHCATGYRSAIAANLLLARGSSRVGDLAGGFEAWRRRAVHA